MGSMKSVKTKIIISFALLALLSGGALGIFSLTVARKTTVAEVDKGLIKLIEQGANVTESRIETQLRTLEVIAGMEDITSMNWDIQRPVLEEQMERTNFLALAIVSSDGTTYYTDGTTANLGDRDYVKKAFDGNPNVSDIIVSRVTNETVLMYATPIKRNGQTVGVLIGRRDGNALSNITNDINHGETGYAYMINDKGTIVAHKEANYVLDQWNPIQDAISNNDLESLAEALKEMIANKTGLGNYIFEGKEFYNVYAPIDGTNWIIAVTVEADEVLAPIHRLQNSLILILVVVLVLAIVVTFFIGNSIAGPVIIATDRAQTMASGDFTSEMPEKMLKREDEIGKLAQAFYGMQNSLRELIGNVLNASETVSATSEELSASIEEISSNAQNQASTTQEVSSSMEEMSANVQVVSDNMRTATNNIGVIVNTMDEIENTISENTKNLEDINHSIGDILSSMDDAEQSINLISEKTQIASKEAEDTVKLAGEGKVNLDRSVSQMESIQSTIQNLSRVIYGLGESADQIGEITDLIKDVAEQTNLLALNASIEAARAGEHGKGFAVVAQAIGTLAEESSNATKEITHVIKNIQLEIGKAVQSTEEGTKVVENGTELVKETSTSLEKIFEAIQITADIINEITGQMELQAKDTHNVYVAANDINSKINNLMAAMEEETAAAAEINNEIQSINELINEINASMHQQALASEEVSRAVNENAVGIEEISLSSEEIARSSEDLAENAQRLVEQVQQFKI
jgi:methyl-accepting chemotaxis protein